jgi:hypothetical protein
MPDTGNHCPFLNRADGRCAEKMNLSSLDYAYRFCFDAYRKCPVYMELLVDRRLRRLAAVTQHDSSPLIQLSISHRGANRSGALAVGASGH